MKRNLIISILLIGTQALVAQQYNPANVSKKAVALYEKAMTSADDSRYQEALGFIEEALKIYPSYLDAILSKAGILGEMKRYSEAAQAYESALFADPEYAKEYYLPYSINLAGKGDFGTSLTAVNVFLNQPGLNETSIKAGEYRKKNLLFALDYKKSNTYDQTLMVNNAGDAVNSSVSEYFPSLTIDGKRLIFTRRVNNSNEDFYSSEWSANNWTVSQPLVGSINTPLNEGGQQVSQDGKWLIYVGCNFPDSHGGCDIYLSALTAGTWGARENLGTAINSEFWESTPCLSPDKNDLYFSSNRSGGYGASDIYVSHRLANGKWSTAQNLGPTINTVGDESFPFMHADNETLYFTSNGLQGYGGTDIFMTKKGVNDFDKPINVGYPINTIDNEGSLIVTADGKTAYFASDRSDSKGGLDIYSFALREGIRPVETSWVQGRVYDQNTKSGLQATVELVDVKTRRMVSQVQTDSDGNYLTTLPKGKTYAFSVNKKGSLFYSSQFVTSDSSSEKNQSIDIPLQTISVGANVVLKNIFFNSGKFDLLPESIVELEKLIGLLKENPSLKIQINGHTDNVGKDADNLILSEARAKSVIAYLIAKGIPDTRLSFKGFGASVPIAKNDTEEGRAMNRRTEAVVIAK
jgi:outer membrane protein OmpA-like peptidoglycan-associated protein